MNICKQALRIAAHHPLYLAIYIGFLSLMGVFLIDEIAVPSPAGAGEEANAAVVAIIDRDGSEVSHGLREHLGKTDELLDIADEPLALQDALATSRVDAMIIVPEGFGDELMGAARSGANLPELDVAYGSDMQAGALAAQRASGWLSLTASAAAIEPHASAAAAVEAAVRASEAEPATEVIAMPEANTSATNLAGYLTFSTYTLTSSIVVVAGVVFARLGAADVRRRQLASPVSTWRQGAGALLGCALLAFAAFVWVSVVGLTASGGFGLFASAPAQVALALASIATFALVPLALAYTLAQCGFGEEALNAIANMTGMVMSFLGGAWMPLTMLGPGVQAVARFTPMFWAIDGMQTALGTAAVTGETLARVGTDIGVTLLFAAAIASVGLVFARLRVREA